MTIKAAPSFITNAECFRPVLEGMRSVLLTSAELGSRYNYSDEHLCALRKNGRGWPFMKLETGGIRYRLSDILAAEYRGTTGPLTIERVAESLAACAGLTPEQRAVAQAHVRETFTAW